MTDAVTFPVLPQGHKRFSVEQLLRRVAPAIGLRSSALHALLHMMGQTRPEDWTREDREPVFFAAQDVTAADLGKTRRALYNTERQLETLGLVERRVKANGHRSSYGGCGIVFTKLITLVPDLLNLAERLDAERKRRRVLRNRRSMMARHVRLQIEAIGDISESVVAHALEQLAGWPDARRLPSMPIEALETHVGEVKFLSVMLDDWLQEHRDSSTRADVNSRHHIQENTEEFSPVPCNAGDQPNRASCTRPDGLESSLESERAENGEALKTQYLAKLTPDRLFGLASDDLRNLIDKSRAGSATLRAVHLIDGVTQILPYLGINWSAWEKAIEVMGLELATLAVLVLDANRTHPSRPVRNPGGALRAMTERQRQGKFNIVGSLIGLDRRRNL